MQRGLANLPLLFSTQAAANRVVAGIPAAARALHILVEAGALDPGEPCAVTVPGGWTPSAVTMAEWGRLAPGWTVEASSPPEGGSRAFDAIALLAGESEAAGERVGAIREREHFREPRAALRKLAQAARQVVAATGKPTDGLVSRTLNRPVSQFCSRLLLASPQVRPIHATLAAALVGVAMALSLFLGGLAGLYAGAVLFQLASMIDGVDGEIARATFRSSKLGATLDTASDAATNFAFIGGVAFNLWQRGETPGAEAGLIGLACLVTGLTLLGARSLAAGGPLSFDALKHEASARRSRIVQALGTLVSRDVYALLLALMILAGLAGVAMMIFAGAAGIWLALVLASIARRS